VLFRPLPLRKIPRLEQFCQGQPYNQSPQSDIPYTAAGRRYPMRDNPGWL